MPSSPGTPVEQHPDKRCQEVAALLSKGILRAYNSRQPRQILEKPEHADHLLKSRQKALDVSGQSRPHVPPG